MLLVNTQGTPPGDFTVPDLRPTERFPFPRRRPGPAESGNRPGGFRFLIPDSGRIGKRGVTRSLPVSRPNRESGMAGNGHWGFPGPGAAAGRRVSVVCPTMSARALEVHRGCPCDDHASVLAQKKAAVASKGKYRQSRCH